MNEKENQNEIQLRKKQYISLNTNKFKQQKLKAWPQPMKPKAKIKIYTATYFIFFIIFTLLGIIRIAFSNLNNVITLDYSDCSKTLNYRINFTLPVPFDINPTIYYRLTQVFQNHRRYVQSLSYQQLAGNDASISSTELFNQCGKYAYYMSSFNVPLLNGTYITNNETVANPCGLIAKSFFNETYKLFFANGTNIFIDETSITWPEDRKSRFRNSLGNYSDFQWIDKTDEHFINWMRVSATQGFLKLWGRPNMSLPEGEYYFLANCTWDASFKGNKSIVLMTLNKLGGRNYFLGSTYLVCALFFLILGILFQIGYHTHYKFEIDRLEEERKN